MVQLIIARYSALPQIWLEGLPLEVYQSWLMGTMIGGIVVLVITQLGLSPLKKQDKAGKTVANWATKLENALWVAVVLDALAPILLPALVCYGIAMGVRTLWQSTRRNRAT